ncbi:MAG: hypothetical protein CME88_08105 [Hirschia sp.]|nr:hypothetical protein [Hirschia sp.]MBF18322.1 hypothetical protein [Hirschia sp.]
MKDPLLGAKIQSILAALRADLKPELTSGNALLRCELIEMLLARMSIEVDAPDIDANDVLSERDQRNAVEDQILETLNTPVEIKGSSTELTIPPETFTKWLASSGLGGKVTKVTTVPGGRSKGTLLLDLEGGKDMVIRRDFAAAVTGTSVADEYPIIAAVHGAGLCVPEPLALEESPDVIGGRFIAFEKIGGKSMGNLFATDASPQFCRNFAAELAKLHNFDYEKLGLADVIGYGRDENPVETLITKHEADYKAKAHQLPLIDSAFEFLHSQLPHIGNHRHLVHGDCGLHNTMGDGDTFTGLLDWEFSHAGDPAEDLAYCKFLVTTVMPWEDFMAAYYDAGGPEISARRLSFFTVWRTLILSVWTGMARAAYDSGTDRDLRLAAIGHNTFPRQLRALANDLADAIKAEEAAS